MHAHGDDVLVAEELLHVGDVHANGQQVGGQSRAQQVEFAAFADRGAARVRSVARSYRRVIG